MPGGAASAAASAPTSGSTRQGRTNQRHQKQPAKRKTPKQDDASVASAAAAAISVPSACDDPDLASVAQIAYVEKKEIPVDDGNDQSTSDYVLSSLCAGPTLHSVVAHDALVGPKTPQDTPVQYRQDARRVARKAVENLQKSAAQCARLRVGTPTFTGRFGVATSTPRFGSSTPMRPDQFGGSSAGLNSTGPKSSAALLAHIRSRQSGSLPAPIASEASSAAEAVVEDPPLPGLTEVDKRGLRIAKDLERFLNSRRRGATTDEILTFFGAKIKPNEKTMFREVLKELCVNSTTRDGAGLPIARWHLKPQFQEGS